MFGFLDDAFYSEKRIALTADPNAMVEELLVSDYGEHNMLVYPNRRTFRQLYSKYCRNVLLENNSNSSENEMILIISYYDTVSNIRNVLKRMGIDLDGDLRNGPIVLVDSVTAYSCSNVDQRCEGAGNNQRNGNTFDKRIWASNEQLGGFTCPISYPLQTIPNRKPLKFLVTECAKLWEQGLCVIADMGSFYLLNRIEELVDYECSYAPKFDKRINLKAFCCHHRQEVKKALTIEQQSQDLWPP